MALVVVQKFLKHKIEVKTETYEFFCLGCSMTERCHIFHDISANPPLAEVIKPMLPSKTRGQ